MSNHRLGVKDVFDEGNCTGFVGSILRYDRACGPEDGVFKISFGEAGHLHIIWWNVRLDSPHHLRLPVSHHCHAICLEGLGGPQSICGIGGHVIIERLNQLEGFKSVGSPSKFSTPSGVYI